MNYYKISLGKDDDIETIVLSHAEEFTPLDFVKMQNVALKSLEVRREIYRGNTGNTLIPKDKQLETIKKQLISEYGFTEVGGEYVSFYQLVINNDVNHIEELPEVLIGVEDIIINYTELIKRFIKRNEVQDYPTASITEDLLEENNKHVNIRERINNARLEQMKLKQQRLHNDEDFKNNLLIFINDNGETEFELDGTRFKMKLEVID